MNNSDSLSSSSSTLCSNLYLNRRQAQTYADTVLISNRVNEAHIRAAMIETQVNAEELEQRIKVY